MRKSLEFLTVPLLAAVTVLSPKDVVAETFKYFSQPRPLTHTAFRNPSKRGLYDGPWGPKEDRKVWSVGQYQEEQKRPEEGIVEICTGVNAPFRHPKFPSRSNKLGLDELELEYCLDPYAKRPFVAHEAFREDDTPVYMVLPEGVDIKYMMQEIIAVNHATKKMVTLMAVPFDDSDFAKYCRVVNELLEAGKSSAGRDASNELERLANNLISKLPDQVENVVSWTKKGVEKGLELEEQKRLEAIQKAHPGYTVTRLELYQANRNPDNNNPFHYTIRGRKFRLVLDARKLVEESDGFVHMNPRFRREIDANGGEQIETVAVDGLAYKFKIPAVLKR